MSSISINELTYNVQSPNNRIKTDSFTQSWKSCYTLLLQSETFRSLTHHKHTVILRGEHLKDISK